MIFYTQDYMTIIQLHQNTKIYRVERDGRGMWYDRGGQHDPVITKICAGTPIAEAPMPFDPSVSGFLSGVADLSQLLIWFPPDVLAALIDHDYRVFALNPRRAFHDSGRNQVWFEPCVSQKTDITEKLKQMSYTPCKSLAPPEQTGVTGFRKAGG